MAWERPLEGGGRCCANTPGPHPCASPEGQSVHQLLTSFSHPGAAQRGGALSEMRPGEAHRLPGAVAVDQPATGELASRSVSFASRCNPRASRSGLHRYLR